MAHRHGGTGDVAPWRQRPCAARTVAVAAWLGLGLVTGSQVGCWREWRTLLGLSEGTGQEAASSAAPPTESRLLVAASAPSGAAAPVAAAAAPAAPERGGAAPSRLVIVGFDGVDPRRVERLVRAGRLPHIARLPHRSALTTTNPPQSPVAWAAFATGKPPGEHGIFDFIARDRTTYVPRVATTEVLQAEIAGATVTPASALNLRQGEAFWDILARAGIATSTLTVPYAYPPVASGARSLAGLGTPDLRGTNSSFTWLTGDAERAAAEPPAGGQVGLLVQEGTPELPVWRGSLEGPRLRLEGALTRPLLPVELRAQEQAKGSPSRCTIKLGGAQANLAEGETSPYLTVEFAVATRFKIRAVTRVSLQAGPPRPQLYVEPLSVVPEAPYFPLAAPPSFAVDLWQQVGPFKTVGWVHDTSALSAGAMQEEQFLKEAEETTLWREKALLWALERGSDALVVAVFTAPDRIGHMFYRYLDPRHPARPQVVNPRYAQALDQSYIAMDRIVGAVQQRLRPKDLLLVVSDHGFGSFRRGFNMNRWLVSQGYLALKRGVKTPGNFFADVDWSRTRAFALGTGGIFLNIRGRDASGVVPPRKARALAQRIRRQIMRVRDGKQRVVVATYLGDEIFAGSRRVEAPDIRVAMADGYRASWATSLGGVAPTLFEDNQQKWSGDHASARPQDMPGILFANRRLNAKHPRIEDIAVEALKFFRQKPPADMTGRPLLKSHRE